MLMRATVFEIAEGGLADPPPLHQVWVLKGLVQEGLIFHLNILKVFRFHDFVGDFCEIAKISAVFESPEKFQTLRICKRYISL